MTCSEDQKVTSAILKVDLQCRQCYRKIKKTLCRFPQIRDQVYDEKQNTVSITVLCCSPERILDKLCSKAGKTIKSVYIKPNSDHPKPKPTPAALPPKAAAGGPPKADPAKAAAGKPPSKADPPKAAGGEPPKAADPPKAAGGEPPKAAGGDPPKAAGGDPPKAAAGDPPKAAGGDPPKAAGGEAPKVGAAAPQAMQAAEPVAQWIPGYPPGPPPQVYPVSMYCPPSYDVPNYYPSYGHPPCPPPYYPARCDYFTHDNPSVCSIM